MHSTRRVAAHVAMRGHHYAIAPKSAIRCNAKVNRRICRLFLESKGQFVLAWCGLCSRKCDIPATRGKTLESNNEKNLMYA